MAGFARYTLSLAVKQIIEYSVRIAVSKLSPGATGQNYGVALNYVGV